MKQQNTLFITIKLRHNNRTIPTILFLNESTPRISETTLKFSTMLLNQGKSDSLIHQYVRIIGTLISYKITYYNPLKAHPRLFLEQFIKDITLNNIPNQKPFKKKRISYVIQVIKDFSRWLTKSQDLINDPKELEFAKFISTSYIFLSENHIGKIFEQKHTKGFHASKQETTILKSFPTNKLFELLKNAPLRDKLIISMMAFSGRRPSELLHLFTHDIEINQGLALKITHPSLSMIGKLTKREYLKKFNLIPRNELSGSLHAGFRGIKFENQKELFSESYFIFNMDQFLIPLHEEYMKLRNSYDINHPYYFINLKDGSPLTLKSMEVDFYNLCEDIGLSRGSGVSPMGLRHFYGGYLSQGLKLEPLEVKRFLSQISPQASLNYYNDKEIVWKELKRISL